MPPVELPALKIKANPKPTIIPPYILAKNLSSVNGGIFENISIKRI